MHGLSHMPQLSTEIDEGPNGQSLNSIGEPAWDPHTGTRLAHLSLEMPIELPSQQFG